MERLLEDFLSDLGMSAEQFVEACEERGDKQQEEHEVSALAFAWRGRKHLCALSHAHHQCILFAQSLSCCLIDTAISDCCCL